MLKIKNYVKVKSLEEAYELLQKRGSCILGGMLWLKMSDRRVSVAIDLCELGLDGIYETEEEYQIGCMTSLHELEKNESLNSYTQGALRESLRHIVGVQFRNCATVGGSIYGRYGFSDVLTVFMGMNTEIELYHAGRIPLEEFAKGGFQKDILVRVIVKKCPLKMVYLSQRNTKTDFPVLTCCASLIDKTPRTVIGARPYRAAIMEDTQGIMKSFICMNERERLEAAESFSEYVSEHVHTDSNLRGSAQYRSHLAGILTGRAWRQIGGMADEN